jgi:5'-3' exonuclease
MYNISYYFRYANLVGSTKEILKNNESILCSRFQHKTELDNIHWKDKIDEVCFEYKRDSLHCLKMLDQWNELKYKMNEKNAKDIENLLLKSEIAEMKANITKLSCIIRMYTETASTINAFKILNLNLEEKINNITEEIIEKGQLIKSYEVLNSTEYDEILRKYLNLCYVVQKKKNLLNNL